MKLDIKEIRLKQYLTSDLKIDKKRWDKLINDDWKKLDNGKYEEQEKALKEIFKNPSHENVAQVLIKIAILNDFYSTNIFYTFEMAKHIMNIHKNEINIKKALEDGNVDLVEKIANIPIENKEGKLKKYCFYSFASKYCSHHNEEKFPIYDNLVSKVLLAFNKYWNFSKGLKIEEKDLRDYKRFKAVLEDFKTYHNLSYSFKELDKCLWQIGKKEADEQREREKKAKKQQKESQKVG